MRFTRLVSKTLRSDPPEGETNSHRLMLKAGLVQQVAAGVYSYPPPGLAFPAQDRGHHPAGNGRGGRPGADDARPAAHGAVGADRPQGRVRRQPLLTGRPPGPSDGPGPHPRGGRDLHSAGQRAELPGTCRSSCTKSRPSSGTSRAPPRRTGEGCASST